MALTWSDNFNSRPDGKLPDSIYGGGDLPNVGSGGRNGGKRVTWNQNALSIGGGGSSFFRSAMRIDNGGNVVTPFMAGIGQPSNSLNSRYWLFGGAYLGFAYSGIVATEDGAIAAVNGGAFELGPNSTNVSLLGISEPGVVPIGRGWFLLEVFITWSATGTVRVRINGETVLLLLGVYTKSPEDYCVAILQQPACPLESPLLWPNEVTEIGIGGFTRGGRAYGGVGWTGSIDFLAAFDEDTGDIADMAVSDLVPIGDGALSQSTITGTTPAATRWQSVSDALTPDGDQTTVTFSAPALGEDEYTLSAFPFASGTIYGVQGATTHRVSAPGYAAVSMGASDGVNAVYSQPILSRSRDFVLHGDIIPERPAGGAWTPADLSALRMRVKREA